MNSHQDYRIGWICALPLEMAAAEAMLDKIHLPLSNPPDDKNVYVLGSIGPHYIVITCLPSGLYGTTAATTTALRMQYSYRSIENCFLVGIGGGAPSPAADIRLGDVVVSKPTARYGGIIQYDYGKFVEGNRFALTGSLNKPSEMLLKTLARLEAKHMLHGNKIETIYNEAMNRYPLLKEKFHYPGQYGDRLFLADYEHVGGDNCCSQCDPSMLQNRPLRTGNHPRVFYGLVASANRVMKNGKERDRLSQEHGVLCFEMEAAGLMDLFPCLVIRGVCDYSDSHKNKQWQGYAAITAAAYTKELMLFLPSHKEGTCTKPLQEPIPGGIKPCLELMQYPCPASSNSGYPTPVSEAEAGQKIGVKSHQEIAIPIKEAPLEDISSRTGAQPKSVDVLECLSSRIDASSILEVNIAMARRLKLWHPWPGDCTAVYYGVKNWLSAHRSTLLILGFAPRAYSRAQDLAVEIVHFLLRLKDIYSITENISTDYQVLWVLSTTDPVCNKPVEIVKSIIQQAIQQYPDIPQSEIAACIKPNNEEDYIWDALRLVFSHISKVFVIFASGNAECAAKFQHVTEEFVKHSNPHSTSKVKFLVISCGDYTPTYSSCFNTTTIYVPTCPPQSRKLRIQSRADLSWNSLGASIF